MATAGDGLRGWLDAVDRLGELRRVTGATWQEDIGMATEILQQSENAPAVLFDEIPGHEPGFRVLVNNFGSMRRIALALGLPPEENTMTLIDLWREKLRQVEPIPPTFVDDGPVLQNVMRDDEVNVLKFPTPIWHEQDGGRYIGTASADITRDPDEGWVNLGTYRVMVHDKTRVGFYISPGKHGRLHRQKYFERGEPCPVAVAIGMHPLLYLASATESQYGVSEYDWAGGVLGRPVEVFEGEVTGLPLPVDAEIILEGFAYPQETLVEGPFGEWTGYYASASREEPVLHVQRIYYRDDPIIVGSPPTRPPDEQSRYRAFLRSAVMYDELERAGVPDIRGVWCHPVGGSRLWVTVSIKQRYPGHARQVGHLAASVRSGGYLGRYVIVVDEDIDPTNLEEVVWAMCTRSDPVRSIDIIQRAWSGPLDPAIRPGQKGFNSRAIIDATRPFEWRDEFPPVSAMSAERRQVALERWGHLLEM
ncbi:MAG: UbiD family decarboxylase [Chloroflexi bacterium]|nr:MAG: UbiD family decarboxylase [Chloroflexota bacterium]